MHTHVVSFTFFPLFFPDVVIVSQVTKESFTDDGFFKTGDAVGVDEDGYYIILGRKKIYIFIFVMLLFMGYFFFKIYFMESAPA